MITFPPLPQGAALIEFVNVARSSMYAINATIAMVARAAGRAQEEDDGYSYRGRGGDGSTVMSRRSRRDLRDNGSVLRTTKSRRDLSHSASRSPSRSSLRAPSRPAVRSLAPSPEPEIKVSNEVEEARYYSRTPRGQKLKASRSRSRFTRTPSPVEFQGREEGRRR